MRGWGGVVEEGYDVIPAKVAALIGCPFVVAFLTFFKTSFCFNQQLERSQKERERQKEGERERNTKKIGRNNKSVCVRERDRENTLK